LFYGEILCLFLRLGFSTEVLIACSIGKLVYHFQDLLICLQLSLVCDEIWQEIFFGKNKPSQRLANGRDLKKKIYFFLLENSK
jgi:hypothetical protein